MSFKNKDISTKFVYCPDGSDHMFEEQEEWNDDKQQWSGFKVCLKCKTSIYTSIKGCPKSYDQQHTWEDGTFHDEESGLMQYQLCRKCKRKYVWPMEKTLHKNFEEQQDE